MTAEVQCRSARSLLEAQDDILCISYLLTPHPWRDPSKRNCLLLFDVLIEDLRDLARAFLGMTLLAALVVYVGYTEPCCVALGPLEVAAGVPLAHRVPRNTSGNLVDMTSTNESKGPT
jgi:hypothetical protein